jgi:hypothetical protein
MRTGGLAAFLSLGRHQNTYEYATTESGRTGETLDGTLKRLLGAYYERRMAYDSCFVNGRSFRYGALNIGCAGATDYGDFCVVAKSDYLAALKELAYLKSDSLNDYMLPGLELNEMTLRVDLATHSHRHFLAAGKYGKQILVVASDKWPSLICGSDSYVEATFAETFTTADLAEVRMSDLDFDRVTSLLFEAARGTLSSAEMGITAKYSEVLASLRNSGIKLEIVNA